MEDIKDFTKEENDESKDRGNVSPTLARLLDYYTLINDRVERGPEDAVQ